jgi:hypothetical protein
MSALATAASYLARTSGHSHVTVVAGRGFPVWAIVLIVAAVILLLALAFARPYGRYRSRRYVDTGPAMGGPVGSRTIVEEEDVA